MWCGVLESFSFFLDSTFRFPSELQDSKKKLRQLRKRSNRTLAAWAWNRYSGQLIEPHQRDLVLCQHAPVLNVKIEDAEERVLQRLKVFLG